MMWTSSSATGQWLDAARHNDKFAFLDDGFVAPEFHPQRTFHDQNSSSSFS